MMKALLNLSDQTDHPLGLENLPNSDQNSKLPL